MREYLTGIIWEVAQVKGLCWWVVTSAHDLFQQLELCLIQNRLEGRFARPGVNDDLQERKKKKGEKKERKKEIS